MFGQNTSGFLLEDVSVTEKMDIIRSEIQNWKKSRYTFQLRHRVFTALNSQEQLRIVERELEGIEAALDTCIAEWKRLSEETPPDA